MCPLSVRASKMEKACLALQLGMGEGYKPSSSNTRYYRGTLRSTSVEDSERPGPPDAIPRDREAARRCARRDGD